MSTNFDAAITQSHLTNPRSAESSEELESYRAIVFTIAQHQLALPVSAVDKIVRAEVLENSQMGDTKLVHLNGQTIPVVDLHPFLVNFRAGQNQTNSADASQEQFFILARTKSNNLSALLVDEPPNLMELTLNYTYMLPPSHQQTIQSIATHVTVLRHQHANLTILLLDLEKAIAASGYTRNGKYLGMGV